jgi:hypothetical protein
VTGAAPGLNEKAGRVEGPKELSLGSSVAPGLKLKSGSADGREGCLKGVEEESKLDSRVPAVDLDRRPVALENEEGAEDGLVRAGNTNGGFGGGTKSPGEA